MTGEQEANHHIFVDESGDDVLFGKGGQALVGQGDSPLVFLMTAVHLPDPGGVRQKLDALRRRLMADPYFATAPSMLPEARKTAEAFHAKDDLGEVKHEVFKLLPELGATVHVAVRRKNDMLREAQALNARGLKLEPFAVYDELVKKVMVDMIPPGRRIHITFAKIGHGDRIDAMRRIIGAVRKVEQAEDNPAAIDRISISAAFPKDEPCLQVADYYSWAIEKVFRKEIQTRYYDSNPVAYRKIWDLDDRRNSQDGEIYHAGNPVTHQKIKPVTG